MSRNYAREYAVTNWPPGMLDPLEPPEGYVRDLDRIDEEHRTALGHLRDWHRRQVDRKTAAWVEYHDEHGWPDDPDYQERLRQAVPS